MGSGDDPPDDARRWQLTGERGGLPLPEEVAGAVYGDATTNVRVVARLDAGEVAAGSWRLSLEVSPAPRRLQVEVSEVGSGAT